MRDHADLFRIASARGALDAGMWAAGAACVAAIVGWWIAANWQHVTLARALLASFCTASGIAALWYAVRMAIDRRLFAAMANHMRMPDAEVDKTLGALDEALSELGWINADKAGRSLSERVRGTAGLLRASVMVAAVQWIVVGVALVARGFC